MWEETEVRVTVPQALSTLCTCEESAPKEEPQTCAASPEAMVDFTFDELGSSNLRELIAIVCGAKEPASQNSRPTKEAMARLCVLCLLSITLVSALVPQTSSSVVSVEAEWSKKGDDIDTDGIIDVQALFPPQQKLAGPTDEEIGSFAPELYPVKWNFRTVSTGNKKSDPHDSQHKTYDYEHGRHTHIMWR
ncbi:hypothetical protein EJB05_13452, partial [Eragrostis curvula]